MAHRRHIWRVQQTIPLQIRQISLLLLLFFTFILFADFFYLYSIACAVCVFCFWLLFFSLASVTFYRSIFDCCSTGPSQITQYERQINVRMWLLSDFWSYFLSSYDRVGINTHSHTRERKKSCANRQHEIFGAPTKSCVNFRTRIQTLIQ